MIDPLDRAWRGFGTGLFLALIGVGGTALALTLFPLICLVTPGRASRQRRFQAVLKQAFALYCRAVRLLGVADISFHGAEKLKDLRGVVVVANHPSLLDGVMIMSAMPRAQCIVKAALWRHPFFFFSVRGAGYIRNDLEPDQLVAACRATLAAGNNLIVFPEGTRTPLGGMPKLTRGFAHIATLAEADVQLVTITCTPPILYKGERWWNPPARRPHFVMEVGDRLDIRHFLRYRSRPLAARKLVAFTGDYFTEKLSHDRPGTGLETPHHILAQA
jgi:1-acyl-sn-glycerol-3-phosphate acyltransferase